MSCLCFGRGSRRPPSPEPAPVELTQPQEGGKQTPAVVPVPATSTSCSPGEAALQTVLQPLLELANAARHSYVACLHLFHLLALGMESALADRPNFQARFQQCQERVWAVEQFIRCCSSSGWVERLQHMQELQGVYTWLREQLLPLQGEPEDPAASIKSEKSLVKAVSSEFGALLNGVSAQDGLVQFLLQQAVQPPSATANDPRWLRSCASVTQQLMPRLHTPSGYSQQQLQDEVMDELLFAAASASPGPHQLLRNPGLRTLWWIHVPVQEHVSWQDLWGVLAGLGTAEGTTAAGISSPGPRPASMDTAALATLSGSPVAEEALGPLIEVHALASDAVSRLAVQVAVGLSCAASSGGTDTSSGGWVSSSLLDGCLQPEVPLIQELRRLRLIGLEQLERLRLGQQPGGHPRVQTDGNRLHTPASAAPSGEQCVSPASPVTSPAGTRGPGTGSTTRSRRQLGIEPGSEDRHSWQSLRPPPLKLAIDAPGGQEQRLRPRDALGLPLPHEAPAGLNTGRDELLDRAALIEPLIAFLASSLPSTESVRYPQDGCLSPGGWVSPRPNGHAAGYGCPVALLIGPSGVGKSAMAAALASQATRDGVWAGVHGVLLSGCTSLEDGCSAICAVLDVPQPLPSAAPPIPASQQLQCWLQWQGAALTGYGLVLQDIDGLLLAPGAPLWYLLSLLRHYIPSVSLVLACRECSTSSLPPANLGWNIHAAAVTPVSAAASQQLLLSLLGASPGSDDKPLEKSLRQSTSSVMTLVQACQGLPSLARLLSCALRIGAITSNQLLGLTQPPQGADTQRRQSPAGAAQTNTTHSSPQHTPSQHLPSPSQLVHHCLPSMLEHLGPRPTSLLLLLLSLPSHPPSGSELAGHIWLPAAGPHPCQLSLDMCQLYDAGLLSFCTLTQRHQVNSLVAEGVAELLSRHDKQIIAAQGLPGWLQEAWPLLFQRITTLCHSLSLALEALALQASCSPLQPALQHAARQRPLLQALLPAVGQWLLTWAPLSPAAAEYVHTASTHLGHICRLILPSVALASYATAVAELALRQVRSCRPGKQGSGETAAQSPTVQAEISVEAAVGRGAGSKAAQQSPEGVIRVDLHAPSLALMEAVRALTAAHAPPRATELLIQARAAIADAHAQLSSSVGQGERPDGSSISRQQVQAAQLLATAELAAADGATKEALARLKEYVRAVDQGFQRRPLAYELAEAQTLLGDVSGGVQPGALPALRQAEHSSASAAAALPHYRAAIDLLRQAASPRVPTTLAQTWARVSECHAALGDPQAATEAALAGLAVCSGRDGAAVRGAAAAGGGGDASSAAACLLVLALQAHAAGQPAEACTAFTAALQQLLRTLPAHSPQVVNTVRQLHAEAKAAGLPTDSVESLRQLATQLDSLQQFWLHHASTGAPAGRELNLQPLSSLPELPLPNLIDLGRWHPSTSFTTAQPSMPGTPRALAIAAYQPIHTRTMNLEVLTTDTAQHASPTTAATFEHVRSPQSAPGTGRCAGAASLFNGAFGSNTGQSPGNDARSSRAPSAGGQYDLKPPVGISSFLHSQGIATINDGNEGAERGTTGDAGRDSLPISTNESIGRVTLTSTTKGLPGAHMLANPSFQSDGSTGSSPMPRHHAAAGQRQGTKTPFMQSVLDAVLPKQDTSHEVTVMPNPLFDNSSRRSQAVDTPR